MTNGSQGSRVRSQGSNGFVVKTLLGACGIVLTVVLTLLASGGSWGAQKEKVRKMEACTEQLQTQVTENRTQLARTQTQYEFIREQLSAIQRRLDKLATAP